MNVGYEKEEWKKGNRMNVRNEMKGKTGIIVNVKNDKERREIE